MTASSVIAVVDDDAAIRTGISSLLRSAGYAVRLFGSGEALLDALPEAEPQCVLTDIQMPGLGGLELQAMLAEQYRSLPIIVMTAFPEPALRQRVLAAGAVCFLGKPFEAEELLECLRRALRGEAC